MPGPLATTCEILAASHADLAQDVLCAALRSSQSAISLSAALALIDRPGLRGQLEILQRLPQLAPEVLTALRAKTGQFEAVLKQLLLHSPPEQRQTGLTAIKWLHAADQIPQLLQLLRRTDIPDPAPVIDTLRAVVTQLDDASRDAAIVDAHRVQLDAARERALRDLDRGLATYDSLIAKDDVIECVLILGSHHHPAVRHILWQASTDCRERAGQLLLASRHPRVMQHTFESLRDHYPHPKAFEAVSERSDPEFLCELCRTCSQRFNASLEQNLKQIKRIAWLESADPPLSLIPPPLQPALLTFIVGTGVPKEQKSLVQDWLLRHGGPAGRMAAAERAGQSNHGALREVLVESLDSEDEHVQAWAVTQLRQRAVPETFSLLLKRLQSPSAEVRQAVREELSDFNTDRVLGMVSSLDAATALRVGALLRQIDAEAISKLEHELHSVVRARRIRAAQAVLQLGYQDSLWRALVSLADDADAQVRCTAAELLGRIREPDARIALETLLDDPQPKVRETAHAALLAWQDADEPLAAQLIGAPHDNI
ncbi:MAG: HEAT repeat domain-containing protein [Planctomycetaceae bacterium]